MATPFPLRPSVEHTPHSVSEFSLGEDETTAVLETLASETARAILRSLSDRPATASELADRIDTSLQNAYYHLTNLREVGLVTDAGTWYSSKGREMTVYALTSEQLQFRIEPPNAVASAESSLRPVPDS